MQEALQKIIKVGGYYPNIHVPKLMEYTHYVPFAEGDEICWEQAQWVHICDCRSKPWYSSEVEKLRRGIYVSVDGSWVLVNTEEIGNYLPVISRYGANWSRLLIRGKFGDGEDIDLERCRKLQTLYIRNETGSGRCPYIHGLSELSDLNELYLIGVANETLDLSPMRDLTMLGLEGNWNAPITVEGFQNVKKLRSLELTNVSWGGELDLSGCTELQDLFIAAYQDTDGPWDRVTGLAHLHNLEYLSLRGKLLDGVLDVSGLEKLRCLEIHRNRELIRITGLGQLPDLEYLDLSGTGITEIPGEVRDLKSLEILFLGHLNLKELPDWLPELGLPFTRKGYGEGIMLYGTTVEGVDMSIFDQPQEVILQWFEERRAGKAVPLNEVKVVFLGDGEAGKTHTISRLLKDGEKPAPEDFDGTATPGIVISNKDYPLSDQRIQVHFWDFGGQEILHSMHRMFLTERTLYVVVINARDDTQDDRARYWLHNIKSFAGTAPVLLVLNKIDQNPNASIDLPSLQKMYGGLKQVVRLSALEYSREEFNRTFTAALLRQVQELGTLGTLWPASWLKLKKGLENMQTHYIHGGDYEDLCEESGVEQSREELLHWFNDLGVSFCYGGSAKLEDYVILKPVWLTNAIYIILFNKCEETKNGIIPHRAIDRMLGKPRKGQPQIRRVMDNVFYTPQEADYVMDVIRKFRLSYKVREDAEFIPVLCQRESLSVAEEYANDPDTLEFSMEYAYLPDNVIHRLMVEMRGDLNTENVWRTGAQFIQQGTAFSAVVRSDGNVLRIYVRSQDPMHKPNTYLHIIKGNIDRINADMHLEPPFCEVIYKDGSVREAFDYEDLINAKNEGETDYRSKTLRRRIPIENILNQSGQVEEEALKALRNDIINACMQLQGNKIYWDASEDDRNTFLRDALRNRGYLVNDQSFQGVSGGTGKKSGELDLEIRRDANIPWTICEALKVSGVEKADWNRHLEKLLDNYNPSGLNYLFLVTYVDCGKDDFPGIWDAFREHIRWFNPGDGKYERLPSSLSGILLKKHGKPNDIQAVRITYDRAGSPTTVCHFFVRMGR